MTTYEKNWDDYSRKTTPRKFSQEWAVLREARESHWREFFIDIAGKQLLDAGCGHGEYTAYALQDGASVWSFDQSTEMVVATKDRLKRLGLHAAELYRGSVTDIPHPDERFDVVFCLAVLDHLSTDARRKALSEFHRVLKPGGMLYLDVPNRLALHWRLVFVLMRLLRLYPAGKIHFFTPWEIRCATREAGFETQDALGLTFCPPFSGIYTTDLRRITCLPEWLIRPLDKFYLFVERHMRRIYFVKPLCWHYFMRARKAG